MATFAIDLISGRVFLFVPEFGGSSGSTSGSTYAEVNTYGTDPTDGDTDNDGLSDGYEIAKGLNQLDSTDCPNWICIDNNRRGWRLGLGL